MKNLLRLIKREKLEPEEGLVAALLFGAVLVVIGVILSAFAPVGLVPILAMSGALISFLSLIFLIILWFVREGLK